MGLEPLLAQVQSDWFSGQAGPLDARILAQATRSPLGQRLLARHLLASGAAATLLAPRPAGGVPAVVKRWPPARLGRLIRDLGVLAYAPVIRAEVRREPVRWLRRALGNSYLLALDPTVWDARIGGQAQAVLQRQWEALVQAAAPGQDDAALYTLLECQGRAELRHWALSRDPGLAEWAALLHPPEPPLAAHLPEKPVLLLSTHHETRKEAA